MKRYFYRAPGWLKAMDKTLLWEIEEDRQNIYLTFDDGPVPSATSYVLDLLNQFGAKATFFSVGENVEHYPEILKSVLQAGHSVGNHTYHHVSGWKTSLADYRKEVESCHETLLKYGAIQEGDPLWFRPPYGRITKAQRNWTISKYNVVMWSYLSGDFDRNLNTKTSLAALKKASSGAIVVFHDNEKYISNLKKVLPEFLQRLTDKGYMFAALSSKNDRHSRSHLPR